MGAVGATLVGVAGACLGGFVSLPGESVSFLGNLLASVGTLHEEFDAFLSLEQRDLTQDRLLVRFELVGPLVMPVRLPVTAVGQPVTTVGQPVTTVGQPVTAVRLQITTVGLPVTPIRRRIDDADFFARLGCTETLSCSKLALVGGVVAFDRGGIAVVGGPTAPTRQRLPLLPCQFSVGPRRRMNGTKPSSQLRESLLGDALAFIGNVVAFVGDVVALFGESA